MGVRKREKPKVEGVAFPGAALVDLADIERSGTLAVEHTHGKPTGKPHSAGCPEFHMRCSEVPSGLSLREYANVRIRRSKAQHSQGRHW